MAVTANGKDDSARQTDEVPSPQHDVVGYLQYVQKHIQGLTRSAASLPSTSDLSFHRSLDRSLAKDLDATRDDLMDVISQLVHFVDDADEGQSASHAQLRLEDVLDSRKFKRTVGDAVDTLLERTDTCLDEYTGRTSVRQQKKARNGDTSVAGVLGPLPPQVLNAQIRPLPQQRFSKKPDNARERTWGHSLTTKPHAKVPLAEANTSKSAQSVVRQGMYSAEGDPLDNPYHHEIEQFEAPEHALELPKMEDLQPPPPLLKEEPDGGLVPFLWVHDETTFNQLYDHLMEERVKEVAIDVEHHNYRSYQGLVCLVQVSTRWQDFIIDALEPAIRDISHKLNDVFADPNKVKVLHGAEHDVLWLQRDLNLYLVGLFDTYHATNVLHFTQHSLAFLLHRYIDFVADKRYQLADWRIRPLIKEMLYYARSDTHSLLYVYDCMRFEVGQAKGLDGIRSVFEQSKRTAAKTYAKEVWTDGTDSREGWRAMWQKVGKEHAATTDVRFERGGIEGLDLTERLFRALHDWRDKVARDEDESPRYILNSANMLVLSTRAPQTREEVQACVGSALKKRVNGLTKLINKETSAFEESQKYHASRKREMLEQASLAGLLGTGDAEELGEILDRSQAGQKGAAALWPRAKDDQEQSTNPQSISRSSSLAPLLFADGANGRPAKVQKKAAGSLFAPVPKSSSIGHLLQSIRADLAVALRSVLGSETAPGAASEKGKSAEAPVEAESTSTSVPSILATTGTDERGPASETIETGKTKDEGATEPLDSVLQVRKAKDKKKAKPTKDDERSDSATETSKQGKKRKWTKEEKAERKRQERERLAAVEPFDYSTASSVLDRPSNESSTRQRAPKESAKDKRRKTDSTKKEADSSPQRPHKAGRYDNVAHGRDRREQAGGKSMTFSR